MELAYIIMLALPIIGVVVLVLLGRAADTAEARYERLLEQYPEYRDAQRAGQRSKHLFE